MPKHLLIILAGILGWAVVALAQQPVPALTGRVIDLTATLSASTTQTIETALSNLEQEKGSQVAVLIVPTTAPEAIEQFGIRVAETWKLGRKGVDDGVILLIAKDDRALRIEVGYGLEGAIPDARAKQIIDDIIVPYFKAGNFDGGILAGVDAISKLIRGEPLPEPHWRGQSNDAYPYIMVPFFAIFFLSPIYSILVATRAVPAGVPAGLVLAIITLGIGLITAPLMFALFLSFIAFVIGLTGGTRGGRGLGSGGWSSSGGGWSGGGGGGFSGGGGSFGGGGASGRW